MALDIIAIALLFWNVLSRPRSQSQQLLDMLYDDGLFFFLVRMVRLW